MSPIEVLWSDVIRRIKLAAPKTPLYVWCNEDTPLIWEELIRLFTGISTDVPITGQYDVLTNIISPEGMQILTTGMVGVDPEDTDARQTLIAEVLEAHALPELVEDSITLPELNDTVVATITEAYEADLAMIADMEGVELILPFD
ncbi:hypothetical protein QTO30_01320 [Yoonia sp. GPGPB17]|uniref:hypothetical protein n=1 Tax=Yoonia sp. GPGPB17 TaxID=3026147 RepID=UPI0030BA7B0E